MREPQSQTQCLSGDRNVPSLAPLSVNPQERRRGQEDSLSSQLTTANSQQHQDPRTVPPCAAHCGFALRHGAKPGDSEFPLFFFFKRCLKHGGERMFNTRREQPPHKHLATIVFLYPERHDPAFTPAPSRKLPTSPRQHGFKIEALVVLQHFLHI